MGDLKARIRATFTRSKSSAPSLASSANSDSRSQLGRPASTSNSATDQASRASPHGGGIDGHDGSRPPSTEPGRDLVGHGEAVAADGGHGVAAALPISADTDAPQASDAKGNDRRPPTARRLGSIHEHQVDLAKQPDSSATESSTDDETFRPLTPDLGTAISTPRPSTSQAVAPIPSPTPLLRSSSSATRPRRSSLIHNRQTTLIKTLLGSAQAGELGIANLEQLLPISPGMVARKVWVRRPGGSATLVTVTEDDVVDDVRDMVLRKYANSLGRQFDAPDLTLRVVPREQRVERALGPEEPLGRALDAYFPGGQTVDEALLIDVPLRRTPRASPRTGPPHAPQITSAIFGDEIRPAESGTDYFGPSALASTAHVPLTLTSPLVGASHGHSIAVLTTGQVPQLPSPGGTRSRAYRDRPERPRLGRQHTSSPTAVTATAPHAGNPPTTAPHDQQAAAPPAAPPLPTPPAPEPAAAQRVATPPPRVASPRPATTQRVRKSKKIVEHPKLPAGMLGGGVPPINVLIVEDNIINLKLLEAFVKRLKVRWSTAMNGRDAVTKWRAGGFHLVLMDIQLPVMSGLEATREIRRLERVNSIGVFSSAADSAPDDINGEPADDDKLPNVDVFKSPVIIVALTASSLQSDRHEALAAGCNDFLTKPVNFVWLERKVMEWGCMQALIDFDGWRKWKDFAQKREESEAAKKPAVKAKKTKNRQPLPAGSSSVAAAAS